MENQKTVYKGAVELVSGDVLIGDEGGTSVVYTAEPSNSLPGLYAVETEHGFLYLDPNPEITFAVLDESGS